MLMIAARMVVGLVNAGMVVEMERDLTKVTEEFDRALNVEYLQQIKETGERSFLAMVDSQVFVQSKAFCLSDSKVSRPTMTVISGVQKAPAHLSSNKSWTGQLMKLSRSMRVIYTGFMDHRELAKHRWLIRSVQAFTSESGSLAHFSAREMTQN